MKASILAFLTAVGAVSANSNSRPVEDREVKPGNGHPYAIWTNLVFADGALYNDSLPNGAFVEQFPLNLAIWPQGFLNPYALALVAHDLGHGSIERRLLQAYVDQTPGAPKPVAFTADNATLSAGQTTYGWRNDERILYFAPDDSARFASGMQWMPTAYSGVAKLFWNQTLFEVNKAAQTAWESAYFVAFGADGTWADNLPSIFN